MKKHIITIAGAPGSGKSTTAKGVAAALGYDHFSSGDLFRKIAAERGMTIEEINFAAEKQKEIDRSVDESLVALGKERDRFVIDSRTAFHWMPESFKVFLELDLHRAVERMFAQIAKGDRVSQEASSVDQLFENTVRRIESEKKRFRDLYQIDFMDMNNYDLVVDTSAHGPEEVAKIIIEHYEHWLGIS